MDLRDYVRGLRRHWFAIVLMTVLGIGAGYGWSALQTPVYEASASGFVQSRNTTDAAVSITGDQVARSKVASYIDIGTWRGVAEFAIEDLGLSTTPEALAPRVTVTNTPQTVILRVTAQAGSPTEARDLAEAWVRAMAAQIDELEGDGTPGSSEVTVTLGGSASLPSSPVFPDVQSALIVGGLFGLGFGVAFALIRSASDRRVRSAEDIESKTGVAVVGSIPAAVSVAQGRRLIPSEGKGTSDGSFAISEGMRALRTNLQFMDVDNPPRVIVVTSPLPGDGKSTVACNLATTVAAGGQPVVLIDGDLRRSMVGKTMGLPSGAGLTDVLAGRAELGDVLQRAAGVDNFFVLTAGSVPPNPSEVLGSERMRSILADLSGYATIIIDAPPLLPVTDGAVLTHQADGALLVVSHGSTTIDLVEKSLATLAKASGRALGIVLNKVPLRGLDATQYTYDYRSDDSPVDHAPKTNESPAAAAKARAPRRERSNRS
ncbi:polysaccharide biosynthesis tyrosine autokinase [Microbacterium lacus]|uniref:polysaccharide biosynthesis tyrosine autokinase n=1 Tax=Microbacterium lacus TaxID=415217 RepID=UPI00384C1931